MPRTNSKESLQQPSLCDGCRLTPICSIRVLEREVGEPLGSIDGPRKQRVLACKYYTRDVMLEKYRELMHYKLVRFMRSEFAHVDESRWAPHVRRIVDEL